MDSKFIAETYRMLDRVQSSLSMCLFDRQSQICVFGRTPLQVHSESSSVNEHGLHETFNNSDKCVTIRLDGEYATGAISGDAERRQEPKIVLLSDDRKFKLFEGGVLKDFTPKPHGSYPITEAFQTIEGDYTLARSVLHPKAPTLKMEYAWDYPALFTSGKFSLDAFIDPMKFMRFAERVMRLDRLVKEMQYPNAPMAYLYLDNDQENADLVRLIDCCWPVHKNRTFYTAEETVLEYGRDPPRELVLIRRYDD